MQARNAICFSRPSGTSILHFPVPVNVSPDKCLYIPCLIRHAVQFLEYVLLGILHKPDCQADCVGLVIAILWGFSFFHVTPVLWGRISRPLNGLLLVCCSQIDVDDFFNFFRGITFLFGFFLKNLNDIIRHRLSGILSFGFCSHAVGLLSFGMISL